MYAEAASLGCRLPLAGALNMNYLAFHSNDR
jgi:hypothetical protein